MFDSDSVRPEAWEWVEVPIQRLDFRIFRNDIVCDAGKELFYGRAGIAPSGCHEPVDVREEGIYYGSERVRVVYRPDYTDPIISKFQVEGWSTAWTMSDLEKMPESLLTRDFVVRARVNVNASVPVLDYDARKGYGYMRMATADDNKRRFVKLVQWSRERAQALQL